MNWVLDKIYYVNTSSANYYERYMCREFEDPLYRPVNDRITNDWNEQSIDSKTAVTMRHNDTTTFSNAGL